jgi:6-phosphogluconolactonase
LPSTFSDGNSTAEVLVHPNGRFVYGSNRGHHSLAVFTFDEKSGMLTAAGHVSTEGKTPRNFRIDPSGAFVLAENQDTHTIVPFRVDPETGLLSKAATPLEIDSPVCIKFYDR